MFDFYLKKLTAKEDGEIRTRVLSKLEQNSKISRQMVVEGRKRIENLRHDAATIEKRDMSKINLLKNNIKKDFP